MSITTENNRTAELVTDGSETEFDFSMLIHDESEVSVYFKATGGSYAQLTLNSDYGVTYTEYGGTVSTDGYTAPLAAGTLLIIRHIDITQQSNYVYNDIHTGQRHQDDFDRTVMRDLQIQELIKRAVKFAIHSSTKDIAFPEPEANKYVGWDSAGAALTNKTPDALGLTAALNDLSDVDVGSPTIGDMVQWDGSSWKKVSNISVASIELVKPGNVPGSNGNSRKRIVGDYEIYEKRTGGAWVATGRKTKLT